jgi:S-DNA-T family DNA segregation ATPase FtsK/SpoIIIE
VADLPDVGRWSVPLGLTDQPEHQRQDCFAFDLDASSHLLVVGGPRSGRSSLVRALAAGIGARFSPGDVHLYAIDSAAGATAGLDALPHCGALAERDERRRAARIVSRLVDEVSRRLDLLARAGYSSISEQRARAQSGERLPWLVLAIDGWEAFVAAHESDDHGATIDLTLRLLRDGGAAGLRAIVTGDRSSLTGRLASVMGERLVLRLADAADYSLAGLPARAIPEAMPPGRGLLVDGVIETQIALLARDPAGPAQREALRTITDAARNRAAAHCWSPKPLRVVSLPTRVESHEITGQGRARSTGPMWALLGVGGDEGHPLGVDLAADASFLIAGPPGSGRSTALTTMALWLLGSGIPCVTVAPRSSPLQGLRDSHGLLSVMHTEDDAALRELDASSATSLVLLVDDIEHALDRPIEAVLQAMVRRASGPARAVVGAGSIDELASTYRGLGQELRKNRCGLVLTPGLAGVGADNDVFGVRVGACDDRRPGRGVLVTRGRTEELQVALPGTDRSQVVEMRDTRTAQVTAAPA